MRPMTSALMSTAFRARTDLEGSGIEVPHLSTYATRLVNFVRENPRLERGT